MNWDIGIMLMVLTFLVIAIDVIFIPTSVLTILSVFSYLSYLLYVYLEVSKTGALILLALFLGLGGGGIYFVIRYRWWQIISHRKPLAKDETFYQSLDHLHGKTAQTLSELRPSGKVLLSGKRYDALAQSSLFIAKDVPVTVTGTSGSQLIVKPLP
ncbi:hypothetical protein COTS27_01576 [Spirochaetota bacterium]|nr:hypothetical protein COTS27_01576 [Spirochaetota bacterium]